jgi:hypothetical protein
MPISPSAATTWVTASPSNRSRVRIDAYRDIQNRTAPVMTSIPPPSGNGNTAPMASDESVATIARQHCTCPHANGPSPAPSPANATLSSSTNRTLGPKPLTY